jgi:hypothetical protein
MAGGGAPASDAKQASDNPLWRTAGRGRPTPTDEISFRHLSPEVPESRVIADNPRASADWGCAVPLRKLPANRHLRALNLAGESHPGGRRFESG